MLFDDDVGGRGQASFKLYLGRVEVYGHREVHHSGLFCAKRRDEGHRAGKLFTE